MVRWVVGIEHIPGEGRVDSKIEVEEVLGAVEIQSIGEEKGRSESGSPGSGDEGEGEIVRAGNPR